jgi:hypothetical protein
MFAHEGEGAGFDSGRDFVAVEVHVGQGTVLIKRMLINCLFPVNFSVKRLIFSDIQIIRCSSIHEKAFLDPRKSVPRSTKSVPQSTNGPFLNPRKVFLDPRIMFLNPRIPFCYD